jgi:hypothetical protein
VLEEFASGITCRRFSLVEIERKAATSRRTPKTPSIFAQRSSFILLTLLKLNLHTLQIIGDNWDSGTQHPSKRKREQRNRRESLRKGLTGKIRTLERESVCFPDLPRKIQIIPSELSVCSIVPVCAAFSLSIAKISTISRKKGTAQPVIAQTDPQSSSTGTTGAKIGSSTPLNFHPVERLVTS